jgi:hypothetical protein
MEGNQLPLELVSNFLSIVILVLLGIKYFQYKKKLDVLKRLDELKKAKKLTVEDKEFIKSNFETCKVDLGRTMRRLKMLYPVFILAAGVLLAFLSFKEALIHLNVVVVAYIYLHVSKIHARNFVTFLDGLVKGI